MLRLATLLARAATAGLDHATAVVGCAVAAVLLAPSVARAQEPQGPGVLQVEDNGTIRFRLPTITVTAQKESENVQELPVSVTAVTSRTLENAGVRSVSDAAALAPNTYFTEFTARKLSNARFRGIGASPGNPSVTTYIDGVPQLNANSSSIELIEVDQIEFVRGPQSALFGRNTLGGLVNVTSSRPSLTTWGGSLIGPSGNFRTGDVRGTLSGPLVAGKLALGIGAGYSRRDGYTRNEATGHDLDSRSAAFGKVQALWAPQANWEVRGILTGERARDGDYGLNDLAALRARPRRSSRDFEGSTDRDLIAPTLVVTRTGTRVDVSSTTGFVWWKTNDLTDLDYTALPLVRRANEERDHQLTEEVRFGSSKNVRLTLSPRLALKWQAGIFVFTQHYTQDAVNSFSPFVASPLVGFPLAQHSPQSALDDRGVGVYGQGLLTWKSKLDFIAGLRGDHENKRAELRTFFVPAIAPPAAVNAEKSFNDLSPQFTAAYHAAPGRTAYITAARGFKAGGFNPASPPGSEAYGQERTWNYEAGAKTSWLDERVSINGGVFYIRWRDLQVNVANPYVPTQFYIANAGGATSKGVEIELNARPRPGLDLFGGLGYTNARFRSGSVSNGVPVGRNKLPNTPSYTFDAGVQYSRAVSAAVTLFGRADLVSYGAFQYDDANTAGQDAYALANFRAGARGRQLFVEGWVRNAFDTEYVPTAFPYPGGAPSGFIGESGAPRTFGVRAGLTF